MRGQATRIAQAALDDVQTIVVIYAENHSFDNMYGLFPGAERHRRTRRPSSTRSSTTTARRCRSWSVGGRRQARPALPAHAERAVPHRRAAGEPAARQIVPSPIHAYYHNQEQINGGRNNMFAAMSTVGGWTMGYYDGSQFKLWQWAQEYTLADNFFMGAFGGSYLNHQYLICACAPRARGRARLDARAARCERQAREAARLAARRREGAVQVYSAGGGQVTPDGLSVNTTQPPYQPSGIPPAANGPPRWPTRRATAQRRAGAAADREDDRRHALARRASTWAWYAGGWNQALADGMQPPRA